MLIEVVSNQIYPAPAGFDFNDKEAVKEFMSHLPIGAFLIVLAAWGAGSFGGGLVSSFVIKHTSFTPSLIVGVLLTLAGLSELIQRPHPWWMWAGLLVFIPLAWMGHEAAVKIQHE
jgi:hypothetical protein